MQATAKWSTQLQFAGTGNGGHPLLMDGESKAGNSPMELVLLALCGCTAYDVVSILQKSASRLPRWKSALRRKKRLSPREFSPISNCYTGLLEKSRGKRWRMPSGCPKKSIVRLPPC